MAYEQENPFNVDWIWQIFCKLLFLQWKSNKSLNIDWYIFEFLLENFIKQINVIFIEWWIIAWTLIVAEFGKQMREKSISLISQFSHKKMPRKIHLFSKAWSRIGKFMSRLKTVTIPLTWSSLAGETLKKVLSFLSWFSRIFPELVSSFFSCAIYGKIRVKLIVELVSYKLCRVIDRLVISSFHLKEKIIEKLCQIFVKNYD